MSNINESSSVTGEGGNSNLADEILSRGQVDEQPISPIDENKGRLDKLLHNRPKESELVEKNIMKDSKVAPSLQAAQSELQRHQLEDKLEYAIMHRPPAEELVREGILTSKSHFNPL